MLDHGGGQIVVVSSLQGLIGIPHRSSCEATPTLPHLPLTTSLSLSLSPADSASKHALHGYFDSLRCELAPRGISVCLVCPGYINTQLSLNALAADGSKHGGMSHYNCLDVCRK